MNKIILVILFTIIVAYSDTELKKENNIKSVNYKDRIFYSIGMLDENNKFVCIDGEKWIEKYTEDKIELSRIYYWDDELKRDIPVKCI